MSGLTNWQTHKIHARSLTVDWSAPKLRSSAVAMPANRSTEAEFEVSRSTAGPAAPADADAHGTHGVHGKANGLLLKFILGLLDRANNAVPDNRDYDRFPAPPNARRVWALQDFVRGIAARLGWYRRSVDQATARPALEAILERLDGLAWLHDNLADDTSRELLLLLLEYRVLGSNNVALPLRYDRSWQQKKENVERALVRRSVGKQGPWSLDEFEYQTPRGPIRVALHTYGFATTFLAEHYALRRGASNVFVHPGDVVIDGGGCWGDTALYFASEAGETGHVYSFEFDPKNLELLRANLDRNPKLRNLVTVVEHALWRESDKELAFEPSGPGTALAPGTDGASKTTTLSIDTFVERQSLTRIDFIKMDIEGAELDALIGAEQTLRRFKPRLAISLYHSLDDYFRIPQYLAQLELGYRFHLHHATIHMEETLLFAVAE
jgi:FkbM family methyltransferase